jgi:hypothetical protein
MHGLYPLLVLEMEFPQNVEWLVRQVVCTPILAVLGYVMYSQTTTPSTKGAFLIVTKLPTDMDGRLGWRLPGVCFLSEDSIGAQA